MHGFQNNLAQLFFLRRSSTYRLKHTCSDRLKVQIPLESQMIKWSLIELVQAINSTSMHGFENNLAQLFISTPLKSFTIIAMTYPWHPHARLLVHPRARQVRLDFKVQLFCV